MPFSPNASDVYRDHVTKFVPASGVNKPKKSEIRTYLRQLEDAIDAVAVAGSFQGQWDASSGAFPSGAQKGYSWIVGAPGTVDGKYFAAGDRVVALVNGASTSVYAGNWVSIPAGTSGVVNATDAGAGTANSLQVTTEGGGGVRDGVLLTFTAFEATTGTPVTVSVDGGAALTIKSNAGANVSALAAGQLVIGQARLGTNELRLLNDQNVAALVAQAEAAAAAAALSASTIDLPSAVALTYLRQKADLSGYEPLNATQVQADLDPLKGFAGDGVADDAAKFFALRALPNWATADLDLRGKTHRISSDVPGPYSHGFLKKLAAVGSMDVEYPQRGTLDTHTVKLSDGRRYTKGFQDTAHKSRNGGWRVYAGQGGGHTSLDTHVVSWRSVDGGRLFTEFKRHFQKPDREVMCFAATEFEGQEIVITRERTLGPNVVTAYRMMVQHCEERRAKVTAQVTCQNGLSVYRMKVPDAGVMAGNRINISNVVAIGAGTATVGGQNLNNRTFTVTYQDGEWIVFSATTGGLGNASFDDAQTINLSIAWIEDDFTEVLFRVSGVDVSFGEAVLAYGAPFAALPTVIQSIAALRVGPNDADIRLYLGASGNVGGGVVLFQVSGLFRGTVQRAITGAVKIGSMTAGLAEPSVCVDKATGDLWGGIRSQDPAVTPYIWYSNAANRLSPVAIPCPAGREVGYLSPVLVRVLGNYVYVLLVGDRQLNDTVGDVPVHLLVGDKNAIKAAGNFSPFRAISLDSLYHAVVATSDGVGVGSMLIDEELNKIALFYSDEGTPLPGASLTSGTTVDGYCTVIGLDPVIGGNRKSNQVVLGRKAVGNFSLGGHMADVGYFEELAATNALYAWGFYDGATLLRGYNMANATESPTGVYTCPLIVPAAAGAPFASSIDNNVSVAKPRSTLATTTAAVVEFRISGALASGRFFVGVVEKRDRYRI